MCAVNGRYLFALQVKRDLSTGALPCHEHTAILLASYIVQCLYHTCVDMSLTRLVMPPPVGTGEGGSKCCFCPSVRLSVCPSCIQQIIREPKGLACAGPNSEGRFSIFDATHKPVSRSKVKVTRPINAHTHRAPYLRNVKAYELHTWSTDGG